MAGQSAENPLMQGPYPDLTKVVLASAKQQMPELAEMDPAELNSLVSWIMERIITLQQAAEIHPHPKIHEDTDIIWVVPGPGSFASSQEDQPDRYPQAWTRKMDRSRVRIATAIGRFVTALRTDKSITEITQDDIRESGPILVYTGTPWQNEHLQEAMSLFGGEYKFFPQEKIVMFGTIQNANGTIRDSNNTADAIESFRFPKDMKPRRIVIVSHAEHLVRIVHILGKYSHVIPEGTIVQVFPIASPQEGRLEYTIMEARGILAYIFKHKTASLIPHPYVF